MARKLTRLRIDEVSSVDRGAGEGVNVVLMKRDDAKALQTRKDNPPMPSRVEQLTAIAKQHGLMRFAKFITEEGASGITEHEFTALVAEDAKRSKRAGESDDAAFARVFGAEGPDGVVLRKAHAVVKAASFPQMMDIVPTQVGGADATDVDDATKAYEQVVALAAEMRAKSPELTTAQAFARVMQDPANRELANRAHRRPAPTTSYPYPR